ncbi:MAG: response regulator transcription factor [Myxacorys californica WJT36-NPBG1]|jgi:DNA-binding NarL/FixJ family response regulator|nr:response regulator transcription factor [Myxacorys californica WJT36-NPBG1]
MSAVRVVIVAQSIVMQAGLEALLATDPSVEVIGRAVGWAALSETLQVLQPDVMLVEWNAQIATLVEDIELEECAIVVLMNDELEDTMGAEAIAALLRSGVQGILPLEAAADEIIAALKAAATGLTVLHADVLEMLLALPSRSASEGLMSGLTARETEVLGMLAEGLGNKAIARRLNISDHTVKFHISSILSKLNASSRTEAVILGAKQGWILL